MKLKVKMETKIKAGKNKKIFYIRTLNMFNTCVEKKH